MSNSKDPYETGCCSLTTMGMDGYGVSNGLFSVKVYTGSVKPSLVCRNCVQLEVFEEYLPRTEYSALICSLVPRLFLCRL